TEVDLNRLPLLIVLSLVVSYVIVFAAGFEGESKRHATPGTFQHPVVETVAAYLVAVVASWVMPWLFGRIGDDTAPMVIYIKTMLLAFPASLGAAAGRLAV